MLCHCLTFVLIYLVFRSILRFKKASIIAFNFAFGLEMGKGSELSSRGSADQLACERMLGSTSSTPGSHAERPSSGNLQASVRPDPRPNGSSLTDCRANRGCGSKVDSIGLQLKPCCRPNVGRATPASAARNDFGGSKGLGLCPRSIDSANDRLDANAHPRRSRPGPTLGDRTKGADAIGIIEASTCSDRVRLETRGFRGGVVDLGGSRPDIGRARA